MGFDSLFINRIDIEELKLRRENKLMEFLWVGNISSKHRFNFCICDDFNNVLYV